MKVCVCVSMCVLVEWQMKMAELLTKEQLLASLQGALQVRGMAKQNHQSFQGTSWNHVVKLSIVNYVKLQYLYLQAWVGIHPAVFFIHYL